MKVKTQKQREIGSLNSFRLHIERRFNKLKI